MSFLRKKYLQIVNKRIEYPKYLKYFDSSDYEGLKKEKITIPSKENENIVGYFYYKENYNEKEVVIFAHGFGAGHKAYMQEINYIASHGYRVFAYDAIGVCESEGNSFKGFSETISSLEDVLNFFKNNEKYRGLAVNLIGHSLGALAVGAILNLDKDINKAILLSAPINLKEMLIENTHSNFIGKKIYNEECKVFANYAKLNVLDGINNVKAPILIVHSRNDKLINFEKNYVCLKTYSTNENAVFLSTEDKGHNPTYTEESAEELIKLNKKLKKLKTDEAKCNYTKDIDFKKVCTLDEDIMTEIINFLDKESFNAHSDFNFNLADLNYENL